MFNVIKGIFSKDPSGQTDLDDERVSSSESDEEEQEKDHDQDNKDIGDILMRPNFLQLEDILIKEEKKSGIGTIKVLEKEYDQGVVDNEYFFKPSDFPDKVFVRGTRVNYSATMSEDTNGQWNIIKMTPYISQKEEGIKIRRSVKNIIGKIERPLRHNEDDTHFILEFKKKQNNHGFYPPSGPTSKIIKVPKNHPDFSKYDFTFIAGDWIKVEVSLQNEDDLDNDVSMEITANILSVSPNQMKTIFGTITKLPLPNGSNVYCINNEIYFSFDVVKNKKGQPPLKENDEVKAIVIESNQDQFPLRAVSVEKTSFKFNTINPQEQNIDEWMEEEEYDKLGSLHNDLLNRLIEDKNGIKIKPAKIIDFKRHKVGSIIDKSIDIINGSSVNCTLHKIFVQGDQSVCKFDIIIDRKESESVIKILYPNDSISVKISCQPIFGGRTKELVIFDFGSFKIGRYMRIMALSEEDELLRNIKHSEAKFKKKKKKEEIYQILSQDAHRKTLKGIAPVRAPFFSPCRLFSNAVKPELLKICQERDSVALRLFAPYIDQALTFENYVDKFQLNLHFEEIATDAARRQFDLEQVVLKRNNDLFCFDVVGIRDFNPPILVGDKIIIYNNSSITNPKTEGVIHEIRGDDVRAKFPEAFSKLYDNTFVTVQFLLGRNCFKRNHHAITKAPMFLGVDWLFPEKVEVKPPRISFIEVDDNDEEPEEEPAEEIVQEVIQENSTTNNPTLFIGGKANGNQVSRSAIRPRVVDKRCASIREPHPSTLPQNEIVTDVRLRWFNKNLNDEQKDAVRRILRGQGRPVPYIIFGPPGTGKTVTFVEAIMQIYHLDPNSKILISTPTNSAADVITEYLVLSNKFKRGDLVRLVGFMRTESQISDVIADYCENGEHIDALIKHRIVIATCTTAGQFFHLSENTSFFSHVFIDEAGNCTESDALIPALLVNISKNGQVILAGDPKQLGPVLMADEPWLTLKTSLLERFMDMDLYLRNVEKYPDTKYNPLVLTKLLRNYRANETLLKLPSELFYDNELISCANRETYELAQKLDFLPVRGIPLIFHGIQGTNQRDVDSPSWFNKCEIAQVGKYVQQLVKAGIEMEEIGIITPYRKQVDKTRDYLHRLLFEEVIPKVGSVEEFQGSEKSVIIISTVRSVFEDQTDREKNRMTFIYQPKRFNVAITRAKSLLIIVGNPHVLVHDPRWKQLLSYCIELNAYIGTNLPKEMDRKTKELLTSLAQSDAPEAEIEFPNGFIQQQEEDDFGN